MPKSGKKGERYGVREISAHKFRWGQTQRTEVEHHNSAQRAGAG